MNSWTAIMEEKPSRRISVNYVVFKWMYTDQQQGGSEGGSVTSSTPTHLCSRLLDRYLRTMWTVFPPYRIFPSWRPNLASPPPPSKRKPWKALTPQDLDLNEELKNPPGYSAYKQRELSGLKYSGQRWVGLGPHARVSGQHYLSTTFLLNFHSPTGQNPELGNTAHFSRINPN
jgi:hypothetical protein